MDKLNIIVPCYNENTLIKKFYFKIKDIMSCVALKDLEYKIIFVDDGSLDNTLDIIKKLAEADNRVKYISLSRNFGKEAAIYAGLEAAEKIDGLTVLLDADFQDPPDLISKMFDEIKKNNLDMIIARRISRTGETKIKSFLSDKFYDVINNFSSVKIKNGTRDFRMMKKCVVRSILGLQENNRFSKGLFAWVGFKFKYLDYENIKRQDGETKWSMKKLFLYAFNALIAFSDLPLLATFFISLFIFLTLLCFCAFIFIKSVFFNLQIDMLCIVLLLILFLSSLEFLSIGFLACYISKIYDETKKRPIYITRETNI